MKGTLSYFAIFSALVLATALIVVQHISGTKPSVETPAAASSVSSSAPTAAVAAPAATPKCGDKGFECNKGDVSWMLTSTAFVLLMTVPGLALFYAGMVRAKNALSTIMQSFSIFCVVAMLWVIYGYSLAFTPGTTPFIGSLDKLFMLGEDPATAVAATFSKGQYLPDFVYCMFQLTFAAITVALISGAYAERFKFSAMILFSILWFTFAYLPIAHMVWYWDGPDAYTTAQAAEVANSHAGFIFQKGALDFAGGTVVHINSGIAALVCALMLGKRRGLGRVQMAPHNLILTVVGTGMLWMGWFGFNAGSALEANGAAGIAFFNTLFGPAVAGVAWMVSECLIKGKPSALGICSGIVAGLVAITPAAGYVGPIGAFFTCAFAGMICFFAVTKIKAWLGYDDALDTFGVHCVGGILGSLGTGLFVNPLLGGTGVYDYVANKVGDFDALAQMISQFWDIGITFVWSGLVAFVIMLILKHTIGIRANEQEEEEGLDVVDHGERAYNF
jgi:ammonium transporter, Amt family